MIIARTKMQGKCLDCVYHFVLLRRNGVSRNTSKKETQCSAKTSLCPLIEQSESQKIKGNNLVYTYFDEIAPPSGEDGGGQCHSHNRAAE